MAQGSNAPAPASKPENKSTDDNVTIEPKGTCGACKATFPVTAILVIDKQARCPACGAWFIELRP